ncbi:MAG: hypothetical protein AAB299_03770 [Thermodesulfobacteriota bacterium]
MSRADVLTAFGNAARFPCRQLYRRKAGRKRRRESVGCFKKRIPMPVGIETNNIQEE